MPPITRRQLLRGASGCAALSSTPLLSSLLNLGLVRSVLADSGPHDGFRALVCVFQKGGNDSYNMLVPCEPGEYRDYAAARGILALPREELLPIRSGGRRFGIHSAMPEVWERYMLGDLAFVANVGSLVAPTDRDAYDRRVELPVGLFSHLDQRRHWQTSIPQSRAELTGWAGRMADVLTDSVNRNANIPISYALGGSNILQSGRWGGPYVVESAGATTLYGYDGPTSFDRIVTRSTDGLLEQTYGNLLERAHAAMRRRAIDAAIAYNEAIDGVALASPFPETPLGAQLQAVTRTIAARDALSQSRQIFLVTSHGWDHHDRLRSQQADLLAELSQALGAFFAATEELGVADRVVTFTISDFGRTLTSNRDGSDHAWGGNQLVMGRSVAGCSVHGHYPESLAPDSALDVGRGRLIPTTSVDEYSAELALWFGIPNDASLELVLPNVRRFYGAGHSEGPLGFLG